MSIKIMSLMFLYSENFYSENKLILSFIFWNHLYCHQFMYVQFPIDKIEKGMIIEPIELVNIEDFLRGCRKMKA
ncbi:hypothetical protein, partial [Clostridioides difficile]|uniref:hypothetical protein n=1 Tax=Clostridioides difficile TaxID=1496 RepID=UPI00117B0DA5